MAKLEKGLNFHVEQATASTGPRAERPCPALGIGEVGDREASALRARGAALHAGSPPGAHQS
eukprot:12932003-Alexandrium_andersonii.AAC.1